ncbi:MAG: folate-binding protein [Burkholderiaceae bacterium]
MNMPVSLIGVARLECFGCIQVAGADAGAFLQAQLTSDFASLRNDQARLAGFCSAKGRLQASFIGWKLGKTDVMLLCSADLLAATLKRLSMFVLRMKCHLTDASAQTPVFGLAGSSVDGLLGQSTVWERRESAHGTVIRLPDANGRTLAVWLPLPNQSAALSDAPQLSQDEWRWLQVSSGVPFVQAKTVDLFVPQMINLELLGGVDFQKGCYPGQEIVARSQYRGSLKRRTFLFDCDAAAAAGQEVFASEDPGQPAGVVVNAAAYPRRPGSSLLAEVKLSELQRGSLHLGDAAGPLLIRRELPYAVPLLSSQVA